eukprot:m.344228 g.344228  ORF g.344228 m.344228 type:complete len:200 (-) comp55788_c0_seq28:85-684(-)
MQTWTATSSPTSPAGHILAARWRGARPAASTASISQMCMCGRLDVWPNVLHQLRRPHKYAIILVPLCLSVYVSVRQSALEAVSLSRISEALCFSFPWSTVLCLPSIVILSLLLFFLWNETARYRVRRHSLLQARSFHHIATREGIIHPAAGNTEGNGETSLDVAILLLRSSCMNGGPVSALLSAIAGLSDRADGAEAQS